MHLIILSSKTNISFLQSQAMEFSPPSSTSSRLQHLLLLLLIITCSSALAQGSLKTCGIESIYVFGDSLFDSGNAIVEFPNSYLHNYPNGMTIGKTTGRACDGYLFVDRIAEAAGLPPTNPFLNKTLDHSTGANFAVGGVGLLSKEFRTNFHINLPWSQSSLEIQLEWFDEFLRGNSARGDNIGSSLFVLGGGGNDYGSFTLRDPFFNKHPMRTKMLIMPYVLDSLRNGTKKLIHHGAKKIVLCGVYQGGCLPGGDPTVMNADRIICNNQWNSYHRRHNQLVQQLVRNLDHEHPDVKIVYGDVWGAVDWMFRNYKNLGFKYSNYVRCCGDASHTCGDSGSPFCPDPYHHLFWDAFHFTDHAYRIISEKMIPQISIGLQCGKT